MIHGGQYATTYGNMHRKFIYTIIIFSIYIDGVQYCYENSWGDIGKRN